VAEAGKPFSPPHDRVTLTVAERAAFAGLRRRLGPFLRVPGRATARDLRAALNLRTQAYLVWLRCRRAAIWLVPLGGVHMVFLLPWSVLASAAGAGVCFVGMVALVTELRSRLRATGRRVLTPSG
jgi:hypothetical protein